MVDVHREGSSPPEAIEQGRTLPARSLDFWFDYTCPFAYLAHTQAPALAARMGVPLVYRPLLLGGVFKAVGTPQNLFASRGPARSAHEASDLARWASLFGVELRMPPGHPLRSVEALRATLVTGNDPAVIAGFFRAYWVDGRPISSPEVIADVVARAGHDGASVRAKIETAEIKDALRERTEAGVALGIFGVPAFVVDGAHLYWGQDRLAFVEGVRRDAASATPAGGAASPAAASSSDAAGSEESRGVSAPSAPSATRRVLEVFWDFSSPFAYLGALQVDAVAARAGAEVRWHPILLGGLFRSLGGPEVPLATFSEAKQRYTLVDLQRWAAYWRLPFRFPSRFPTHSLKALRLYLALPDERRAGYREATFRACWADDRDITDEAVLVDCAGGDTLARDALARAGGDDVKAALRTSTEDAAARGVFGVPTFIVDGELYWGQDRLELVEAALRAR
ncbi:MAG: 2-hydroxychromene-2-carboxylate isomerase [Labilithrix sp.]|nr:2-hydroxychromene-2-carboxylate isomerase [Labilithrix sp.]